MSPGDLKGLARCCEFEEFGKGAERHRAPPAPAKLSIEPDPRQDDEFRPRASASRSVQSGRSASGMKVAPIECWLRQAIRTQLLMCRAGAISLKTSGASNPIGTRSLTPDTETSRIMQG